MNEYRLEYWNDELQQWDSDDPIMEVLIDAIDLMEQAETEDPHLQFRIAKREVGPWQDSGV